MGLKLAGLLEGAGEAGSRIAKGMRQERMTAEKQASDQMIWEARQQRMQQMGLEKAESVNQMAIEREGAQFARNQEAEMAKEGRVDKSRRGLLEAKGAQAEEAAQAQFGRDVAMEGIKTANTLATAEQLSKKGISKTGDSLGGTTKAKHQTELEAQGIPREVSRAIAYGTVREIKDQYGGVSSLVDVATGKTVGTVEEMENGALKFNRNPEWTGDKPDKESVPALAPTDPKQRKAGEIYLSPTGRLGRWTGKGWELVE